MSIEVATATSAQLLNYYNEHSGKPPVKKWADRKTAERRVSALLAAPPADANADLAAGAAILAAALPPSTETEKEPAVAAQKKSPAKKKSAAKKPGRPKGEPKAKKPPLTAAQRSKLIADSWKDPKVAKARAIHDNVRAGGTLYRSVRAAFAELGLPDSRHIPFRKKLKEAGKLAYVDKEAGKNITFTIVKKEE